MICTRHANFERGRGGNSQSKSKGVFRAANQRELIMWICSGEGQLCTCNLDVTGMHCYDWGQCLHHGLLTAARMRLQYGSPVLNNGNHSEQMPVKGSSEATVLDIIYIPYGRKKGMVLEIIRMGECLIGRLCVRLPGSVVGTMPRTALCGGGRWHWQYRY